MDYFSIGTKETVSEELIVEINKGLNKIPKFHSLIVHNKYAERKWKCLYCNAGSVPIPDVAYEEWVESEKAKSEKK